MAKQFDPAQYGFQPLEKKFDPVASGFQVDAPQEQEPKWLGTPMAAAREFVGDIKGIGQKVVGDVEKGQQLGGVSPFLVGGAAGGRAVGETLIAGGKAILPKFAERGVEAVAGGAMKAADIGSQAIQKGLSAVTGVGQPTSLGEAFQGGSQLAEQYPGAAGAAEIATMVPILKGGQVALKGAKPVIKASKTAKKFVKEGIEESFERVPAIVDETKVAQTIEKGIEKAIRPSTVGRETAGDIAKYNKNAKTAVTDIVDKKKSLKFVDEFGEQKVGTLPETVGETASAVEQGKKQVFDQYDALKKKAGEKGLELDLNPVADEVMAIADDVALQDAAPHVIKYAEGVADRLRGRAVYTPDQAQEYVKIMNQNLKAFYRNPTYDAATKVAVDALAINNINKNLDELITSGVGGKYGELKKTYGAYKAIEKDIVHRAGVLARQNTKGLLDYTDIFSAGEAVAGILSMNPAMMAGAATQKGIKEYMKHMNNPNTIIKKMFKDVEKAKTKTTTKFMKRLQSKKGSVNPGAIAEDLGLVKKGAKADLLKKYSQAEIDLARGVNPFTEKLNAADDVLGEVLRDNGITSRLDVPEKVRMLPEYKKAVANFNKVDKEAKNFMGSFIGKDLIKRQQAFKNKIGRTEASKIRQAFKEADVAENIRAKKTVAGDLKGVKKKVSSTDENKLAKKINSKLGDDFSIETTDSPTGGFRNGGRNGETIIKNKNGDEVGRLDWEIDKDNELFIEGIGVDAEIGGKGVATEMLADTINKFPEDIVINFGGTTQAGKSLLNKMKRLFPNRKFIKFDNI